MNFFIRQLTPADWQQQKALRLEVLTLYPNVFSASLAETSQRPDVMWQENLAKNDRVFFGLFDNTTNEMIGITAVEKDTQAPEAALFFYSYIKPAYQGQKLSRLFYEQRIAWAKENGKVVSKTWPDGVVENEIFYELIL